MNYFTVDILTPSKIVAKDIPAESLLVPTVRGQINVLAQHTHIVSKLETGLISVFGGADDADRFFSVSTGVCKVLDNKITILAGTSEEKDEIDLTRAEKALKNAQEVLDTQALSDEDYQKWQRKKERAQLRIQLSNFKG